MTLPEIKTAIGVTPDGIVKPDSKIGNMLGFTSKKFDGYLWKKDNTICISFIISKQEGKGNLSRLFQAIWDLGFTVMVPTPFARMEAICQSKGFTQSFEKDEDLGEVVEWWTKEA